MELLILSHFQEDSDFLNFISLVDQELPVFFFFRETKRIWFLNKFVYVDHSRTPMRLLESGIRINGEKEGLWIEWHVNGAKRSEGSYRNGKKEGFWTEWYKNGAKYFEGSYRNGIDGRLLDIVDSLV